MVISGLRSLEFSKAASIAQLGGKVKCLPVPRRWLYSGHAGCRRSGTGSRLTLSEVLQALVAEGLVPKADADKLVADRRLHRGDHHPLVVIADQKWRSLKPPNKVLFLEWLAEWLARQTGMEYFHIDPLKINFSAVTEVMSSHYAARFKILPVAVNTREVVIATCEPYVKDWEKELKQILRLEIRRVIANPLDISRYQVEFYNLAKSVKGASQKGEQRTGIGNFEQLVEIGKTNKQLDANDQQRRPRRRLAVAVRVRSARKRHPHGAAARRGRGAFPHRRRAAPGIPDSDGRDVRDDVLAFGQCAFDGPSAAAAPSPHVHAPRILMGSHRGHHGHRNLVLPGAARRRCGNAPRPRRAAAPCGCRLRADR